MSPESAPPSACVVLVPVGGAIDPTCEEGLRYLEHPVWRVRGSSRNSNTDRPSRHHAAASAIA